MKEKLTLQVRNTGFPLACAMQLLVYIALRVLEALTCLFTESTLLSEGNRDLLNRTTLRSGNEMNSINDARI